MLQKKSTGERTEAILDINESVSRVEDTNTSSSGYNMNSQRYSHTGNMRENLESFNDISSNNIHNSSSNIHNISSNINTSNYQRATIDESGSALSKENVQFLIQETVNQIMNQSNGNLNFKSTSPTAPTTFARVTHDENIYAIISSIQASIQSIESKHTSYETFMKSKLGELEARVESLEHRASSDQRFNASNIHASLGDRPLNGLATKPLGNFSTPLLSDFQNEGSALLISELTSRLEMLEQAIELDKASSSNLSTALILQQQKQERRDYRSELLERLKRGSPLNSRHTSPARRQSQEDDESEEDASGWQGGTTEEILNPDNDSMRRSGSFDPQERSTPRSRASREVVRPNTSIPPPLPSVRNGAMSRSTSRGGDIDMATLSRDDSTITSSNNTGGPNRKRTISGNSYINNPMLSSNGYNAPNGSHIGAPAQGRPNDSMQRTNAIRAAFHQPSFLQPTYASSKKVNNSSRNSPQR